ncbi:type II CAAX prenyl endopeptidase Rce1 family protein [Actinoplanes sp. L3-i22]|uniref:CPBP family glutamic-type intramembrane protease n=1 Tax=Actinoplanes sp. L3-i22 TaxID=2836373 RepID=UPI001C77458F|nr:CPBP family glutamic-type intramembrane protease [Actinoplanes sp. L3-i22]BCY13164.1 hypothetical protein L3i22_082520 [Actinoplanes sp. L3-i22]
MIVEHLLVFYGLVGLFIVAHIPGGPIPLLLVAGAAAVIWLRRTPNFDNRDLWRPQALRPALPAMIAPWAIFSVLAAAGVAVFDRGHLFDMPRQHTLLWLLIVVFYPLASVYPQELLYRAFLLHRYAPRFGAGRLAAGASAAAFGFAHLLFGNVLAVVLTIGGGWLFARRYQRTRSLLTVSVEHALYGITIFTVGLGRLFYHGA